MSNLISFPVQNHAPTSSAIQGFHLPSLSPREWEVLERVAADPETPNKIIAWEMGGISLHTVRALLRTAFMKSGLRSRFEVREWLEMQREQRRAA